MSSRSKKADPFAKRPAVRSSRKRWTEWEIDYVLRHWRGSKDSARISTHFWHERRIHRSATAISKMATNSLGMRGRSLEGFTCLGKVAPGTSTSTVRLLCKELGVKVVTVSHCLALVPNEALPRLRERLVPPAGWITTQVAAKRSGMSASRIREHLCAGTIKGARYCKNIWRVCPASLADHMTTKGKAELMLDAGKWVASADAAKRLGITPAALSLLVRRGRLRAKKASIPGSIGLSWIIEEADLRALESERAAKGAAKAGKWSAGEVAQLRAALGLTTSLAEAEAHLRVDGFRRSSKAIARQAAKLGMLPLAAA